MEQNEKTTLEHWTNIFAEWRKSGESQRGFCRRKDISYSAFGYWRKKVDRKTADSPLVRVAGSGALRVSPGITVRSGALRVELSGEESEEVLGRIFRALGSSACS